MNNKTYIKLGNKIFNIIAISMIEFFDDELGASMKTEGSEFKIKFGSAQEMERFKTYFRMMSTEFDSSVELAEDKHKTKEILS